MRHIYTLFSGSSGNAAYIGDENGGILIDAGHTLPEIQRAFAALGLQLRNLQGVLITHTHSDHVAALKHLTKDYPDIPVCAGDKVLSCLRGRNLVSSRAQLVRIPSRGLRVGDYFVTAFPVSHDSPGTEAFTVISPSGRKTGVCTDLGCFDESTVEALSGCSSAVVECNHDVNTLLAGKYPYYVKQRILGDLGHLSNEECASLCARLFQNGTRNFVLAHISADNNHPFLAYETVRSRLEDCAGTGEAFEVRLAGRCEPRMHFEA